MLVIPALVQLFSRVHRTYREIGARLGIGEIPEPPARHKSLVVVPVVSISRLTAAGISTALSIGDEVIAVNVSFTDSDDEAADQAFREHWEDWHPNVPLVTLASAHRSIAKPIVTYLADLAAGHQHRKLVVLIPEVAPRRLWDYLLFNQRGAILDRAIRRGPADVVLCRLRYQLQQFAPASPGSAPTAPPAPVQPGR